MFKIKSIIFDLDGTLVDSCLNFDKMREDAGIPIDEPILEYLEKNTNSEFVKKAFAIIRDHELRGARIARPINDANDFILKLNEMNFPISILTRNSLEVTYLTLEKYDWSFNYIYARDNAPSKPDPYAIKKIANDLNISLSNILYIGDHDFDLQTARNANCIAGLMLNNSNQALKDKADIYLEKFSKLYSFII